MNARYAGKEISTAVSGAMPEKLDQRGAHGRAALVTRPLIFAFAEGTAYGTSGPVPLTSTGPPRSVIPVGDGPLYFPFRVPRCAKGATGATPPSRTADAVYNPTAVGGTAAPMTRHTNGHFESDRRERRAVHRRRQNAPIHGARRRGRR